MCLQGFSFLLCASRCELKDNMVRVNEVHKHQDRNGKSEKGLSLFFEGH